MALNLRRAVIRNSLVTGAVCLGLGLAVSLFIGNMRLTTGNLLWPILLAVVMAGLVAWMIMSMIKKGVLKSLPEDFSYQTVEHGKPLGGTRIDWESIDDYAIQLEMRGYKRLGDFTTYPLSPHFVGVATCFIDRNAVTLVEVQHIHMKNAPANVPNPGGVHFSIMSLLAGRITVTTTDHEVTANHYLIRGKYVAVASHPGEGLMPLLEKHTRLVAEMVQRTGKRPSTGLNMNRYLLLQRERFEQARRRVSRMSGFDIAGLIDDFEAKPKRKWATSSSVLSELPERTFEALESGRYIGGRATILTQAGKPT
ncbi:MAG: hypothetical protein JNN20_03480 [Betaproteobacteria bacterium]|nr:hypothetical protein [Betaproteobacteria bacterium]